MDAISFALGERASSLRVKNLSDLIHGAHIGQPVSDRMCVTMFYHHDQDQEIIFSRGFCGQHVFTFELAQVFGLTGNESEGKRGLSVGISVYRYYYYLFVTVFSQATPPSI